MRGVLCLLVGMPPWNMVGQCAVRATSCALRQVTADWREPGLPTHPEQASRYSLRLQSVAINARAVLLQNCMPKQRITTTAVSVCMRAYLMHGCAQLYETSVLIGAKPIGILHALQRFHLD